MILQVYLCVHQTALQASKTFLTKHPIKTKEKWRIRNLEKHPRDPGWERALYCQCHKVIRESSQIIEKFRQEPIYIIDAVNNGSGKHTIRSMFRISGVRACPFHNDSKDLLFKDYFFAPESKSKVLIVQSLRGLNNYTGVQVKKLDDYSPEKIVKKIQKNYEHVKKGKKPSSIHSKDWKNYLRLHGIKHVCG